MPRLIGHYLRGLGPVLALVLASVMAQAAAASEPDPQDARALVRDTTNELIERVRDESGDDGLDGDRRRELIDEIIAPNLDFPTMTRLAVGRSWNDASDEQKRALVDEFRELLLRSYSAALEQVEDYSDQEIRYLEDVRQLDETRVEVESLVDMPDDGELPVNYGLRYSDGEWKLFDVLIDGVSLVTTYRSSFNSVVRRDGIEGLIDNLEEKNDAGETEVPEIESD